MNGILHIVGRAYCGKSEASRAVAARLGGTVVSRSDEIRRVAAGRGLAIDRATLARVAEEIRAKNGVAGILADVLPRIEAAPAGIVIVDGTRSPGVLRAYREHIPSARQFVIFVTASNAVRLMHARGRARDEAERTMTIVRLIQEDMLPSESGVNFLEQMANVKIENDGTERFLDDIIRAVESWQASWTS